MVTYRTYNINPSPPKELPKGICSMTDALLVFGVSCLICMTTEEFLVFGDDIATFKSCRLLHFSIQLDHSRPTTHCLHEAGGGKEVAI